MEVPPGEGSLWTCLVSLLPGLTLRAAPFVAFQDQKGFMNVVRHMYKTEGGLKCFLSGCHARALWLLPFTVIHLGVYEGTPLPTISHTPCLEMRKL